MKLISVQDGAEFPLEGGNLMIGREEGNDIVIAKDLLSRRHAKLFQSEQQWLLEDLGSTNGTFVNNRQIFQETVVKKGDVIRFGKEAYYLAEQESDEQTIVAAKLPSDHRAQGGSVVIDEEPDSDMTSFQQSYQLPAGWSEGEAQVAGHSRAEIDKLIDRVFANKPSKPDLAMLFFIADRKPLVFGISKAKGTRSWSLGRGDAARIKIDDPSISQLHANIVYEHGLWRLDDAGSTNGIRVDNEIRKSVELNDGVVVKLGRAELVVRLF